MYPEPQPQDTLDQTERELKAQRQRIGQAFRLLLMGVLAVLILIPTTVLITSYLDRVYRSQLDAQFAVAQTCLHEQDYICARDRLVDLLAKEPDYIAARPFLRDTRYGLAVQLTRQQQWAVAAAELEALLQDYPADLEALRLLESVYEQWYHTALAHGDWLQALVIHRQRMTRFPSSTEGVAE